MKPLKRLLLAAGLLAGVLASSNSDLEARVLEVPSQYSTIREAVLTAEASDTVLVSPPKNSDSYHEKVFMIGRRNLSLIGNGGWPNISITNGEDPGTVGLYIANSPGFLIKGISINHSDTHAIYVSKSSGTITDVDLGYSFIGVGANLYPTDTLNIRNSVISDCTVGVESSDGYLDIRGARFSNLGDSLDVRSGIETTSSNTIEGSLFDNNVAAIYANGPVNEITNNTFYNNPSSVVFGDSTNAKFLFMYNIVAKSDIFGVMSELPRDSNMAIVKYNAFFNCNNPHDNLVISTENLFRTDPIFIDPRKHNFRLSPLSPFNSRRSNVGLFGAFDSSDSIDVNLTGLPIKKRY
jgi:hypothetical protein